MTLPDYSIEQALPHAQPMILLDEILDFTDERLTASVLIRRTQPMFGPKGVPAHVALEYMAQGCGAFVGVEALRAGGVPRVGLLLGTRNFFATRRWIHEGEHLQVTVTVVFRDNEMGVFDCRLEETTSGESIASARLTVCQPGMATGIEKADGTDGSGNRGE